MRLSLQDTRSLEIHEAAISSGRFAPTFVRFLNHVASGVDGGITSDTATVTGTYFLSLEESYGYELTRDADGWFVSYIERSDERMGFSSRRITHLTATVDAGGRVIDLVAELYKDEPLPEDDVDTSRISLSPGVLLKSDRVVRLGEPSDLDLGISAPVRKAKGAFLALFGKRKDVAVAS